MLLKISDFHFMAHRASIRAPYVLGGVSMQDYSDCVLRAVSQQVFGHVYGRGFCYGLTEMLCEKGECPFYGSKKELYREKSTGFVKRKEGNKNEKMYI